MPQVPRKLSNFLPSVQRDSEQILSNIDQDLRNIFSYLEKFPRVYTQSAEPTLSNDDWGFWKDTDNSKFYLILNIAGTQKKVELT